MTQEVPCRGAVHFTASSLWLMMGWWQTEQTITQKIPSYYQLLCRNRKSELSFVGPPQKKIMACDNYISSFMWKQKEWKIVVTWFFMFFFKMTIFSNYLVLKTLRPKQNGYHFADETSTYISVNQNIWILIKISLKFIYRGPINDIPALVKIMAWRRPGDKPLSEPMMVSLLTYIWVTRPEWVK